MRPQSERRLGSGFQGEDAIVFRISDDGMGCNNRGDCSLI